MTGRNAPLGIVMALLVLSIVVAIILIPWLDEQLQRAIARKAANDNARAVVPRPERKVG
jgi:peptidoglycan/LPS O-acetylase OafA/YrhL